MEEFINQHSLKVLNNGSKPTFVNSRFKTHIDITLATRDVTDVHSWRVTDENLLSDHKIIEFIVTFSKVKIPLTKRVDWDNYQQHLKLEHCQYEFWGHDTIDAEAELLTSAISKALQLATFSSPIKPKQARWWNNELELQQTKLQKMKSDLENSPTEELAAEVKSFQKIYYRNCRKQKNLSWKTFCGNISSPKNMALLNRILHKTAPNEIGSFVKPDGSSTESPSESLQFLMQAHFPGSIPLDNNQNHNDLSIDVKIDNIAYKNQAFGPTPRHRCTTKDLEHTFVTKEKVLFAINSFGPDKAPGPFGIKPKALQHLDDDFISRLTTLYQAIVEVGYTPKIWCTSRVVFIPKPSRPDYTNARAFRPIFT